MLPGGALHSHVDFWDDVSNAALCISITLRAGRVGKASRSFKTFSMFALVTCAKVLSALQNFDLDRMAALGLGGMGRGEEMPLVFAGNVSHPGS